MNKQAVHLLGDSAAMEGVRTLVFPYGRCAPLWSLELRSRIERFPALECVEIGDIWSVDRRTHRSLPERVTTLRLSPSALRTPAKDDPSEIAEQIAWLASSKAFEHITTLDLRPMWTLHHWPDDVLAQLLEELATSARVAELALLTEE